MEYKIINHDKESDTIKLISDEILRDINLFGSSSIICQWYPAIENIYSSIFNLKNATKKNKKSISWILRKKIINDYKNLKIVNMYDFIGSDNLDLIEFSIYKKFKNILDEEIEFISFRTTDQERINKELLINPSDFDKTIKTFTNGRINLSIIYINNYGEIPYIENYVQNIGTNITSLEEEQIKNIQKEFDVNKSPKQVINCGNRVLIKSHKIIAIIEQEAIKFLTDDDLEKKLSSSIKTLNDHENVLYIVKSW